MTVAELIAELQQYDPAMVVRIAQPSHDHMRTTLCQKIVKVEEARSVFSPYHDEHRLLDEEEAGLPDDSCVVLS